MRMRERTVHVDFRLPPTLHEKLLTFAKKQRCTMACVVRLALEALLNEPEEAGSLGFEYSEPAEAGSCVERGRQAYLEGKQRPSWLESMLAPDSPHRRAAKETVKRHLEASQETSAGSSYGGVSFEQPFRVSVKSDEPIRLTVTGLDNDTLAP